MSEPTVESLQKDLDKANAMVSALKRELELSKHQFAFYIKYGQRITDPELSGCRMKLYDRS